MNTPFRFSALLVLAGMIASCTGGASTTTEPEPARNPTAATKATVGILLTDATADDYDHAYVTITSVELLGENGHQLIFSGEETVDLLALRDSVKLIAVSEDVDPDDFSKIRLRAQDMQLVVDNGDGSSTMTEVDLVANGKIDLNPRETISMQAGDVVFASLDWDMNESLKLTETGNGRIIMRPVIFVDIDTEPAFKEGLVRVFGIIESIASDFTAFRLCSPDVTTQLPSTPVLGALCLDIVLNEKSGLFGANGKPVMASDLMVEDPITVLGLLRRSMDGPSVTPMQDDSGNNLAPTTFQVLAIVGEGGPSGTWGQYRGTLNSAVDAATGTFDYDIGNIDEPAVVTGQLFDSSRIFSVSADTGITEIIAADLMTGDRAAADAVMIPAPSEGESDSLNIAIMLSRADPDKDNIRGEILSVDPAAGSLMIATSAGDACVTTDSSTRIFQIFVLEDSVESRPATLADLTVGSRMGASGRQLDCFEADLIIAEGQVATPQ